MWRGTDVRANDVIIEVRTTHGVMDKVNNCICSVRAQPNVYACTHVCNKYYGSEAGTHKGVGTVTTTGTDYSDLGRLITWRGKRKTLRSSLASSCVKC